MEPEGSLPHSQASATCPYPEPGGSSPIPAYYFLIIHLNVIHLSLGLPNGLFTSDLRVKILCLLSSSIRATCPAHLM